jgi:hypothetical protein
MKRIGVISTTILTILLLAPAAIVYGQRDDKKQNDGREHGAQQQRPDQNRRAQPQQHQNRDDQQAQQRDQHRQQDQNWRQDQNRQQDARTQDRERQGREQQQRAWQQQQQTSWQQHRAHSFESEHRGWQQRGGYRGYRVPEQRFRGNFGADHSFRVFGLPFGQYGGRPRFQYGGYWFNVMESYPEYWDNDWYRNDDMYVDYSGDGYYLYNRRYPGRPGVSISISF